MTDQLITLKTAKLAKEKGFTCNPSDCNWTYLHENGMAMQYNEKTCVLIPTQSLLQRWFREVYHISIDVISMYEGDYGFEINVLRDGHYYVHIKRRNVGTYEEALEEGLQESFKLVKDEQSQSKETK